MSGKGSISRMSDECLMKQETVIPFYVDCQAVMRKFTLAGESEEFIYHKQPTPSSREGDCMEQNTKKASPTQRGTSTY